MFNKRVVELLWLIFILFAAFVYSGRAHADWRQEVTCMAENIYYESRGEPPQGQMAVGLVTLNRMHHKDTKKHNPGWPKTVCGVVHQAYQFSWTGQLNKPELRTKSEKAAWRKAWNLAVRLVNGEVKDFTMGATCFHADYIEPGWKFPRLEKYGRHIFYKC